MANFTARRGSLRYKSLKRFKEACKSTPFWDFKIFDTYISFTNKKKISVTSNDICLPICPSLSDILQDKLPNYNFNADDVCRKQLHLRFFVFGDENNAIKTRASFVDSSSDVIMLKLAHPKYEAANAGTLAFYLVPLNVVTVDSLYLKCDADRQPFLMGASCTQRGLQLCTSEPIVHLTGDLMWSRLEEFPFIVCEKIGAMKKAKVVRVHTYENTVCRVNDVRLGKNYCKIHFNYDYKPGASQHVDMKMSMVRDALISFKFNPFFGVEWNLERKSVPIVYAGPSILIPGCCGTKIEYSNRYHCGSGVEITAVIIGSPTNDDEFEVDMCEWRPESPAQILVKNKSVFPNKLETGTCIGEAFFFLAERFVLASVLPQKVLRELTTCICMPGGIYLNATKLTKLSKTTTYTHSVGY